MKLSSAQLEFLQQAAELESGRAAVDRYTRTADGPPERALTHAPTIHGEDPPSTALTPGSIRSPRWWIGACVLTVFVGFAISPFLVTGKLGSLWGRRVNEQFQAAGSAPTENRGSVDLSPSRIIDPSGSGVASAAEAELQVARSAASSPRRESVNIGAESDKDFATSLRFARSAIVENRSVGFGSSKTGSRIEAPATPHAARSESAMTALEGSKLEGPSPATTAPGGARTANDNSTTAIPPASRDDIASLFARGVELMNRGDVAAARLLFQRGAEAQDAKSALALGTTYDPNVLEKLNISGVAADPAQAQAWYEKAQSFGSVEAASRLKSLAARSQ
jgi:hypothetical protein